MLEEGIIKNLKEHEGEDKENVERFMEREERIKNINIPKSTNEIFIVPPNDECVGFKFSKIYSREILSHALSEQDFKDTCRRATKIIEDTWIFVKNQEVKEYTRNLKRILICTFSLLIIALIFLDKGKGEKDKSNKELYYLLCLIFIVICGILNILIVFLSLLKSPIFIEFEKESKNKLQVFLDVENDKNNSVEWKMGQDFFWLEIIVKNPVSKKITPSENLDNIS